MLKLLSYLMAIALFLPLTEAALAQSSAKDIPSTIIAMERMALDASDKADGGEKFLEISDPDVVYIDPDLEKPIHGLEALKAYYRGLPKGEAISGKMVNIKVQMVGDDVAVLTFNYVGKGTPGRGWNCTEVYHRTSQGWRILQTHWSYIKARKGEVGKSSSTDVASTIIAMEKAALEVGTGEGFLAISDPDVVYFDPDIEKPIHGLNALQAFYRKGQDANGQPKAEMLNSKVQLAGDAAVLTFNYRDRNPREHGWNCTEVYRRTPDGWRIIQTHWSYVKSQPAS